MRGDKNYPYWPPGSPQDFHAIAGRQLLFGLANVGDVRIPPANGDTREKNLTPFASVNVFTIDTREVMAYDPERAQGEGPGLMDLMNASIQMVGKSIEKPVRKEAKK